MHLLTATADRIWSAKPGPWQVDIVKAGSPSHYRYESHLRARHIAVPFASHGATASLSEFSPAVFVAVLDAGHECCGGFTVHLRRAPLLTNHRLLRVEQLGSSLPLQTAEIALSALRAWIGEQRRVLRLSLDIFSFDVEHRKNLSALASRYGLRRAMHTNGYTETAVLDLRPSEEELFSALHHSARRKIRQVEKRGLEIRTVEAISYHDRMNSLLQETYVRTQGKIPERNWAERIRLSVAEPAVSRIVGLFDPQEQGPAALIAYAWGCHGDDHVYYSEAASTRDTKYQGVALAYGVMWDLIVWAKRTGASLFDFGGITQGTIDGDDPLGGISDFKRYFSRQTMEVREEWILDDHSLRAVVVRAVHRRLRGG